MNLPSDPMERLIAEALLEAGEPFMHEVPTGNRRIDFYLPNRDTYIEVKRFHSDRTDAQMSLCENIIAVQGKTAVLLLASLLRGLNQEENQCLSDSAPTGKSPLENPG